MLKSPTPGLRRLHNKTKQVAKVQVNIAPYDEVEVSADVAGQLLAASSAFAEGSAPPRPGEPSDDVSKKAKRTRKAAEKKTGDD